MSARPNAIDPEALLEHLDWVRDLAERLVGDPATADDLRQEIWLAASSSAPPRHASLRAWLAGLVKNLAWKERRARARRRQREIVAARDEHVAEDASEIVGRVTIEKQVVACVLELGEPYRSTLLLRYHEQLPPRAIAARQGIPVATVKTRLRRGLAQLREELAERYGSEEEARERLLAVVLAPLGWRASTSAGAGALRAAAALLALVAGVLAIVAARGSTSAPRTVGPETTDVAGIDAAPLASGEGDPRVALETAGTPGNRAAPPVARGPWTPRLAGVVLDLAGRPVPGVRLAFASDVGDDRQARAVSRNDGTFGIEVPAGRGRILVESEDWSQVLTPLVFPGNGDAELVALVAPVDDVLGTVRDGDGVPVAGAHVRFTLLGNPTLGLDRMVRRSALETWSVRTSADGALRLRVPLAPAVLQVQAVGYHSLALEIEQGRGARVEPVLQRLAGDDVVRGTVLDELGAPANGAWVSAGGHAARVDPEGRFQLDVGGARDPVTLTAVAPGSTPVERTWRRGEEPEIRLDEAAARVAGRVVDSAGDAVPGARVRVLAGRAFGRIPRQTAGVTTPQPVTVDAMLAPDPFHPWVETDARGDFSLAVTVPCTLSIVDLETLARARVRVTAPGELAPIVLDEVGAVGPLRCRIVGPQGEPVEGAYAYPFRAPLPGDRGPHRDAGARLVSDAQGRVAWPAIAGDDLCVNVTGPPGWFLHDYHLPPLGDERCIDLPVSREAGLRVAVEDAGSADSFVVLDAGDRPLQLVHGRGELNLMDFAGVVLPDGRSPTYGVPAQATVLVLRRAGQEVARTRLRLTPGEVTVVDF